MTVAVLMLVAAGHPMTVDLGRAQTVAHDLIRRRELERGGPPPPRRK